ncbi:MAG: 50S ribosomal protein L3 [Acidimicrobiia bacterium]|nr:50S ribosomal protein L3 [Acidimicrobiia bacterium]NNC42280.1 50S ribosomal protein L3 [Acidimicrobiia bacterium]NND13521.1 50S ribosomal protein L3 [Acidimicrobiia bacterium]NNL48644.1 50S ribosomal protein L3 [Acidimicrobiia bacterium]
MNALLGEKLGMTQIYDADANAVPVTVIKLGPCQIAQIKTEATDGYNAIQIAYREIPARKLSKPEIGHLAKANVPPSKHLVEIRVDDPSEYSVGQALRASELFEAGQKADVAGISKGKGFSGVMKRHNFKGQPASHGAHRVHRAPGSIGACATPSRVFKGTKMAGRMGGERTTILNLDVVEVDGDNDLIMVRGAVPGSNGTVVLVRQAVKVHG